MTLAISSSSKIVSLWGDEIENNFEILERPMKNNLPDRIITNIKVPFIKIVKPAKSNGIGLVIIPGGGYSHIVYDKESEEIIPTFINKGYTLFILTYRLPGGGHAEGSDVCLADAQQAMRIIREQNKNLKLDVLGVMGFSAGGHVAASLGLKYDKQVLHKPNNELDTISARPDFMILMYPVISMEEPFCHLGSRKQLLGDSPSLAHLSEYSLDNQVRSETPRTLLIHAVDDKDVPCENSMLFFKSLKALSIPTEMHLFENGEHGFSLRNTKNLPVNIWPNLVDNWILKKDY